MRPASFLSYVRLAYFSQPSVERVLYQHVAAKGPASILEMGIGKAQRTLRLLSVALRRCPDVRIRYTGLDLFEGRPRETPGLSLKAAHKLLAGAAVQVKLTPGDPCSALTRIANSLQNVDLVLVSNDQDPEAMLRAWRYLPRMLHPGSSVWRQSEGGADAAWRSLSLDEVQAMAERREPRKAA